MSQKVAFVGVGRMGANMARHLQLDCGHDVTAVYDINKEAASELAVGTGRKPTARSLRRSPRRPMS